MPGPEPTATLTEDLPEGWFVQHYPGRPQAWTLCKHLDYAASTRKGQGHVTWRFCDTLAEAQAEAWRQDG